MMSSFVGLVASRRTTPREFDTLAQKNANSGSEQLQRLAETGRRLEHLEDHAQQLVGVEVRELAAAVGAERLTAREHVDALRGRGRDDGFGVFDDGAHVVDA